MNPNFIPVVERDETTGKVRCTMCGPNQGWIMRTSLSSHLSGTTHQENIARQDAQATEAQMARIRDEAVYNGDPWALLEPPYPPPLIQPRPSMYQPAAPSASPLLHSQHKHSYSPADFLPFVNVSHFDPEAERERLETQAELLMAQAQEDDEFSTAFFDDENNWDDLAADSDDEGKSSITSYIYMLT
jgi:hypothetical protein